LRRRNWFSKLDHANASGASAGASDPRLSKRAHGRVLPPAWHTLYLISRLDDLGVGMLREIMRGARNYMCLN